MVLWRSEVKLTSATKLSSGTTSTSSRGAVDAVQVAVKFKFKRLLCWGRRIGAFEGFEWSIYVWMLRFILGECEFVASLSSQFGSSLWMSGGGHGARRYAGIVVRPWPPSAFARRRESTGCLLRTHAMASSGRRPPRAPTLTLALLLLVNVCGRARAFHSLMAPVRAATRF